ncbi:MAG: GGDEF domain-containing protein [Actinomycetota bacterium]|nr:GGDEF domain-containing protein [Actinomycetota bacterium]
MQVGAYLVLGATGVAGAVVGAARQGTNEHARPWSFLAVAVLLFLGGDLVRLLLVQLGHQDHLGGLAEVLYLAGYPALIVALSSAFRSWESSRDRAELPDAAIITTGAAVLAWVLLVAPAAGDPGTTLLGRVLTVIYPLGDLLLLTMLVRLATAPGARTPAYRLLVLSLMCTLLGDAILAAADGGADVPRVVYSLWPTAYLGVGLAALHPSRRLLVAPPAAPSERLTAQRLAALAAAILVAPALLLAQSWTNVEISATAIGLGSAVLALLVLARLALLLGRVQTQAAILAALAANGALTGLANRRTWDAALPRAVAAADRSGASLCVVLLDLDHFKRFNDEHGHQVGDRLLTEAATAWQGRLRAGDVMARYGGEEFGLLLPGSTPAEALELLARLRRGTPGGQTFSAGVARHQPGEDWQVLLARADAALYEAKARGRNCVSVAAGSRLR